MEDVHAASAHEQVADCNGGSPATGPCYAQAMERARRKPLMSRTAATARRDLARIVGADAVQVPVADRSLLRE